MDPKDERLVQFWEKWQGKKWKFIRTIGGLFGVFAVIIFGVSSVFIKGDFTSLWDYLTSTLFLMHLIFLGVIGGLLYGWIMHKYMQRTYERIKAKYDE